MVDKANQALEARRLLQIGRKGLATVLAVRRTGVQVDDNPQAELDLQVAVAGLAPYQLTHCQVISRVALDGLWPGAKVVVRVDPHDPRNVLVA
jgi:hypothetical protein